MSESDTSRARSGGLQLVSALVGALVAALLSAAGYFYVNSFDKIDTSVERRPNLLSLPDDLRGALRVVSDGKELSSVSVAQVQMRNRAFLQRDLGPLTLRFEFSLAKGGGSSAVRPLLSKVIAPGLQGQEGIREVTSPEHPGRVDFEIANFKATDLDQRYVVFFVFEGDQVPDVDAEVIRGSNIRIVPYRMWLDAVLPLTVGVLFMGGGFTVFLFLESRHKQRLFEKALQRFRESVDAELGDQPESVRQRLVELFERHRPTGARKT